MIQMQDVMSKPMPDFREGSIIKGQILEVSPREVLVDVGYKSDGIAPLSQFVGVDGTAAVAVGDVVQVMVEQGRSEEGYVMLSHERAARLKVSSRLLTRHPQPASPLPPVAGDWPPAPCLWRDRGRCRP